MNSSSLFLIQATYNNMDKVWQDLRQIAQTNDSIVIMGDAVIKIDQTIIDTYQNLYCLNVEQGLLNNEIKDQVNIIEYNQFADLVLKFKRCISLK